MKFSADKIFSSSKSGKSTGGLSSPMDGRDGNLGSRSMPSEHQVKRDSFKTYAVDPQYSAGYKASYTEVYSKNGVPVLRSVTYINKEGEFRTLNDVPFVHEQGAPYNGVPGTVLIKETNPIGAANGESTAAYAYAPKDSIAIVNTSIPKEIKIKSSPDHFGKSGSNPCLAEKIFGSTKEYMEAQARGMAGDISDRSDLLITQGKSKRSPSMIIDEESGALYMADSTGKQSVKMANGGTTFNSADVDMGLATRSRSIVMQENPVADTLPTSNILTPQPVLIPHFAKLTNTVLSIVDFLDLLRALGTAAQLIRAEKEGKNERASGLKQNIATEENNTWKNS